MKRKKPLWKAAALLMLVAALFTACSTQEMQAADIYAKSAEASANIESFSIQMDMNQKLEAGANNMEMNSNVNMDLILKPELTAYQKMTMNMMGQEMIMESYMTPEGIFMLNPMSQSWSKLPAEMSGQFNDDQLNPAAQLEKLQPLVDELEVTTTNDSYELSLSASGDKVKDFIIEELKNSGAETGMEPDAAELESMVINKLDIVYTVDKKTYYPLTTQMTMDIVIEDQGQSVQMVMEMNGEYSNYNGVEEIKVPEEALQAN